MKYIAHKTEDGREQPLLEHLANTAGLCSSFAIDELKSVAYYCGLMHDIGKYSAEFQRRIRGENVRVEHALCGAQETAKLPPAMYNFMAEYCIAGHHAGLSDGGSKADNPDNPTLHGVLKREAKDYSEYKNEIKAVMSADEAERLLSDCKTKEEIIERYAFLTRYLFSCLTDADFLDTESFFEADANRKIEHDFKSAYEKVCRKMNGFKIETTLQKTRGAVQQQVYENIDESFQMYILNMPTGSGKTLCSIRTALKLAVELKKKRIIYVIPYVSIIEQTAKAFEDIFADALPVIQHHSNYDFDDAAEKENTPASKKIKKACENWDAPLIITTNVQFFESLYDYKSSRLRKLHNLQDSIIIFDEVHMLPIEYIQPCIRAIGYISKYLRSKAILMSATMPNYGEFINRYAADSKVMDVITDKSMFEAFSKCRYQYIGESSYEEINERLLSCERALVIVNKRKTAQKLYNLCNGRKYHLSTYMTPKHRSEVIKAIKDDLQNKEQITVISTSLIEAGVDVDFDTVFRENAGIDNIIQSGGRCNREGKRGLGDVFVFELEGSTGDMKADITRAMFAEYDDISSEECVAEYYRRLFKHAEKVIKNNSIINLMGENLKPDAIPFREYAKDFKFIDNSVIGIIIPEKENKALIDELKSGKLSVKRKLQKYTASVRKYELDEMLKMGILDVIECGAFVLNNPEYYKEEMGLVIEQEIDNIWD